MRQLYWLGSSTVARYGLAAVISMLIGFAVCTESAKADELANAAGGMQSREFKQFTSPPPVTPVWAHATLSYADSAVWDPFGRRLVWVTSAGVGGADPRHRLIEYYTDTDNWVETELSWWNNDFGHSYNGTAIDPNTGKLCFQKYGEPSVAWHLGINCLPFGLDPAVEGNWTNLPSFYGLQYAGIYAGYNNDPAYNATMAANTGNAIAWHPGLGTDGGLVAVMGGNRLAWWDGNQWERLPVTGMGSYNNIAVYSPPHNVMWIGAGNYQSIPGASFLLHADKTIEPVPAPPFPVGITKTFNFVDPVSGNFLVFVIATNEMWELDVATLQWTNFTSETTVDGHPGQQPPICWPIHPKMVMVRHDINAILFTTARNNDKCTWLYRHSGGTPPPPPPPPPDPDPGECN